MPTRNKSLAMIGVAAALTFAASPSFAQAVAPATGVDPATGYFDPAVGPYGQFPAPTWYWQYRGGPKSTSTSGMEYGYVDTWSLSPVRPEQIAPQ